MWGWFVVSFFIAAAISFLSWRIGYYFIICPAVGESPMTGVLEVGSILERYKKQHNHQRQFTDVIQNNIDNSTNFLY